ncbi:cyclopropane-fatty-acyl-phospholipid synthase family protein [Xenococcus sp. PCC 7305]|uniref:SAM-dependent methyltransferase n=1 Tax=Xenococcus sp. PCC 7305 TaxID=102125 RepID=UPI00130EBA31|nr:class I SAM-dependent methyltransferase [Xenococcus sp. PCC 7305]
MHYDKRLDNELKDFNKITNLHALPQIFHYWSNRYLSIYIKTIGYKSIRDLFFQHLKQACQTKDKARFCSIGVDNCSNEIHQIKNLVGAGHTNFVFDCIDINQNKLQQGWETACKLGLEKYLEVKAIDLNSWKVQHQYDVILAIQCLHHFIELESIFQKIYDYLTPEGYFITHDMIGRNGHQRWPEALNVINSFWSDLPSKYKFNHRSKQIEENFINRDFSQHGFEGIRAQDILYLLDQTFEFQDFIFWGGVIDPFISRAFGHNYDPKKAEDKAIIDKIQKINEDLLISNIIKPTQMVATMGKAIPDKQHFLYGLSPSACVRKTN